jgi:nitrogenase-stabilizing/protective protein
MSILDELGKLSTAEEFFEALGVEYDPAVVRVARLHILRRMGEYLHRTGVSEASDDEARTACKDFLSKAYADFVASSPIQERVFKVHKDAVKPVEPPKKPFVPLNLVSGPDGSAA